MLKSLNKKLGMNSCAFFLALTTVFVLPQTGRAIDFTVTTAAELYDAVAEANANPGIHTITLSPGDYILTAGDLEVSTQITFQGNNTRDTALVGGGTERLLHVTATGQATLNDLTLRGGRTATEFGAGILVEEGRLALNRCWLTDNINSSDMAGEGAGGAIANLGGSLLVENSLISDNQAPESTGGAIYNLSGDYIIRNSTISGNIAEQGGVRNISISGVSAPIRIEHSLVTLNDTVGIGPGGIDGSGGGNPVLQNTIVANNIAMTGGSSDCSGIFTSEGYNLIGDGMVEFGACDLGDNPTDQIGTKDDPIDPLLGDLQDNGGPTNTHALLANSPALDSGDTANCPSTDQRGASRPFNTECDIGPFELTDCGNGVIDEFEACDDGNLNNGDGCEASCQLTTSADSGSSSGCNLTSRTPQQPLAWVILLTLVSLAVSMRFYRHSAS